MDKVRVGQTFAVRASDWNDIADTVNAHKASLLNQKTVPTLSGIGNGIVRVLNQSDKSFSIYQPVALTDYAPRLNYSEDATKASLEFYTAIEVDDAARPYAIVQEAIEPGQVGRAMIYGITPVKFAEEIPQEQSFVSISPDAPTAMVANGQGSARILAYPTSENPWGVVLLGCGGGGGGTVVSGPKEWALRVGSQEINGELYSTIEVYLPRSVVARYSDNPTKDNIASATQPLGLQSRVVDVGEGWKVWKWFKETDPDVDYCYLYAEMTPSAWSPSVVGSSFEPAIILTSEIDGVVEHDESAVLENAPYTPSASRARALIGTVRKRGKTVSILSNDEGGIRFTFVAGAFALYIQPPSSSSTPEDEGEIELTQTADAFDATTLEEGAKLLWATVPLGSVFRDGFAFGVYDVDFSTTKKKWLLGYREAVVHSMLHFAKFLA